MAEPDIEQWRAEARDWLASVLPKRSDRSETASDRSETAPDYAVFANISEEAEHAMLDRVRAYRRQRYDAGYGAIALPSELGGAGLSPRYVVGFTAEEQGFEAPTSTELISVTTGLVGPTIATFGTDAQREKFARAFLRSDLLCCQLFSEPGAGSDLAAVATTAVRDDDGWRIDGQKVWSSGARFADYGLLLARTDPDVVKQAGLTMFLIPMDAPGVEIRPIRQMSGASSFNEVFLSDVRVGDDMRVGPIGEGWKVANATLGFERTASGQGQRRKGGTFEDLLGLARRLGKTGDPVVRQQLADIYVRTQLRTATTDRVARAAAAGTTRAGGVDRQDRGLAEPDPHRRCRGFAARSADRGRYRRAGCVRVDGACSGRARLPARGRHGRGPAQHHRRTCARLAPRTARRQRGPLLETAPQHLRRAVTNRAAWPTAPWFTPAIERRYGRHSR